MNVPLLTSSPHPPSHPPKDCLSEVPLYVRVVSASWLGHCYPNPGLHSQISGSDHVI